MNKKNFIRKIVNEAFENINNELENKSDEELLKEATFKEIEFEGEENSINNRLIHLKIFVNKRPININGLNFDAEKVPNIDENGYQLHINVPSELRQQGIMTKLYTAFLMRCGNIVSLYSNRVGTYAKEVNKSVEHDNAIDKALLKVAKYTNAKMETLYNNNKEIGVIISL